MNQVSVWPPWLCLKLSMLQVVRKPAEGDYIGHLRAEALMEMARIFQVSDCQKFASAYVQICSAQDTCHGVAFVMLSEYLCRNQSMQLRVVVRKPIEKPSCPGFIVTVAYCCCGACHWTFSVHRQLSPALSLSKHKLAEQLGILQEEDRKELSLRAIVGLSPEQQGQIEDAAGQAEDKYKQAGHAAADQAEQGADAATAQVNCCTDYACKQLP